MIFFKETIIKPIVHVLSHYPVTPPFLNSLLILLSDRQCHNQITQYVPARSYETDQPRARVYHPTLPASRQSTASARPCNIVLSSEDKSQLYSNNEEGFAKTHSLRVSLSLTVALSYILHMETEHKGPSH